MDKFNDKQLGTFIAGMLVSLLLLTALFYVLAILDFKLVARDFVDTTESYLRYMDAQPKDQNDG